MKSLVEAALLDQERRIIEAKPLDVVDKRCRKRKPKGELHSVGWTASRSPCGPDDVDAR